MRKRTLGRECALQILYQHEINKADLEQSIVSFWENHDPAEPEVREFADSLVRGTMEHLEEINRAIVQATENWEMSRMAAVDRNILRFATYELLFVPDIPPKVTINEAVNIAKKFSQEESGKFVNGVLDKISHTLTKKNPS